MADAEYRGLAVELAALPYAVQRAAHPVGGGEVMWHINQVADAVNALTSAGRVVLGLDVRKYALDGSFTEVAWSSYEPEASSDPESARAGALAALSREDLPGEWVLVTWDHSK